ncbi:MAG: hypothetical protein LBP67_10715 [Bacteroidales bacterium]|jgi:hypothetical membrane protein|nr:hypothetical protein [Bacteroidales bacterium]
MRKKIKNNILFNVLIFLLGIILTIVGYYANIKYNEKSGIDALTGASRAYFQNE